MPRIMPSMPIGIASIICGKIRVMNLAMFSGIIRSMNLSKKLQFHNAISVVSGMS